MQTTGTDVAALLSQVSVRAICSDGACADPAGFDMRAHQSRLLESTHGYPPLHSTGNETTLPCETTTVIAWVYYNVSLCPDPWPDDECTAYAADHYSKLFYDLFAFFTGSKGHTQF